MEDTINDVPSDLSREGGGKDFARSAMEEVNRCRALAGFLSASVFSENGQNQVRCQVVRPSGEIQSVLPPVTISEGGRPLREGHGRF